VKKPGKIEESLGAYDPKGHTELVECMKKVIILHGWTKNLDKWNNFLKIVGKKGINYSLPQIPGLTESSEKIWDLDDYVKWLKNIVDKEKGKIILIGHSNGGRIALAFTNQFPEKVEKLILIDSAGIYHNELPIKIKRIVFKTIAKIGAQAFGRARLLDRRGGIKKVLRNLLYKLAQESDYKDLNDNLKQTMINLISTDLKSVLAEIKIPTLIIWGAQDTITPLSDGKLMHSLIKNSKLYIIKDAQHSPHFTHAEEIANIIIQQLSNLTI